MMEKDSKILVHFDTNDTSIYQLKGDRIALIKKEKVYFNEMLHVLEQYDEYCLENKNKRGIDEER